MVAVLTFSLTSQAVVVVVQDVSPGATNWPGTPVLTTLANPSTATVAQNFTSGGWNTNLSQTFRITGTNYILEKISIYAGGGSGTATGTNLILHLYDLGFQTSPEPTPYGWVVPSETVGRGLLNSVPVTLVDTNVDTSTPHFYRIQLGL
jgi:hypothetical protein